MPFGCPLDLAQTHAHQPRWRHTSRTCKTIPFPHAVRPPCFSGHLVPPSVRSQRCSSPWSLSSLFGAVCELPSPSCLSSGKEKQDAPPPQNAYASLGPAPAAFSASELAAMQNAAYASQQPYSSQLYASQLPAAASPPAYNQYNSMVQGAQPIPMSQAHAPVRGCCFSMWRGLAMSPVSGKTMPRAHIALDSSFCFGFVHLPNSPRAYFGAHVPRDCRRRHRCFRRH